VATKCLQLTRFHTSFMNHFFVGQPESQVFVSRIPARQQPCLRAVVLFYPFGQEYMRAHKAFRQLANLMARKGIDAYRFDYPGNGDSYGDIGAIGCGDCPHAALQVIETLTAKHSYQQVDLVGLRFGSLVAAHAAAGTDCIKNVVLWDPYATGQAFVDDIKNQAEDITTETPHWNVHGYEFGPLLRNEVTVVRVVDELSRNNVTTHLLLSKENTETQTLFQEIKPTPSKIVVGPANDWNFVDMEGSILMPTQLIKAIVDHVANH